MYLRMALIRPGCADGRYLVRAKGYMAASIHWADENGPLENWTALAVIALNPAGEGEWRFGGGRAIPPEATHVAARLINARFDEVGTILSEIPEEFLGGAFERDGCFGVMSDLHLSAKPGRIRRAFRLVKDTDCVLLAGDLTNDGLPAQFEEMYSLIDEALCGVPVLSAAGNHDYPLKPIPLIRQGIDDYEALQHRLLQRARALGADCVEDESGAYRAKVRGVEVYGLNAVSHFRRFVFPGGAQLNWLRGQLNEQANGLRMVLCHAPLLRHNPIRIAGSDAPYLSRDEQLQEILNECRNICYISGHTHISLNEPGGCVETDEERNIVYLNDSSVAPTMLRAEETLADAEWTDGAVIRLSFSTNGLEIAAQSISSGQMISRGYYRIQEVTA